jgi:hypothetical protein
LFLELRLSAQAVVVCVQLLKAVCLCVYIYIVQQGMYILLVSQSVSQSVSQLGSQSVSQSVSQSGRALSASDLSFCLEVLLLVDDAMNQEGSQDTQITVSPSPTSE